MSFVSLADASRQLGIDAKTLRRWLSEALLPLQSHPRDGRKKGISRQCLEQLAARHHRALPTLAAAGVPPAAALLPTELLTLTKQLAAMQAQLSLLQQQVQALSQQLHAALAPPAAAPAPLKSAAPAPAGATAVRKPVHVLTRLEYVREGHYVVITPKEAAMTLQADSPAWFAWLAKQLAFRFPMRCSCRATPPLVGYSLSAIPPGIAEVTLV
jgi:hypothetical protein